jgi:hypothetical protein
MGAKMAIADPSGRHPPATSPDRDYCDTCLPFYEKERKAAFEGSGLQALESMKAEGRDPTHGGQAAKRRANRSPVASARSPDARALATLGRGRGSENPLPLAPTLHGGMQLGRSSLGRRRCGSTSSKQRSTET